MAEKQNQADRLVGSGVWVRVRVRVFSPDVRETKLWTLCKQNKKKKEKNHRQHILKVTLYFNIFDIDKFVLFFIWYT